MTPEQAVECLSSIVLSRTEFTESDLYSAMMKAGVPEWSAKRAYHFTQIAWGRVFLDGLGVKFSTEYLCFNSVGEVIETGTLTDEPHFSEAMKFALNSGSSPGFARFALMSSEAASFNNAMIAGSKPENLISGPVAIFMEAPTGDGLERARANLVKRVSPPNLEQPSNDGRPVLKSKPWWKFF